MSIIQGDQISFTYPGSYAPVFENLSFTLDSDWRLGLVGRNGRGKTTLMRILAGQLRAGGTVASGVRFDLFPYDTDDALPARECMRRAVAPFHEWEARMARLLEKGDEASLAAWGELEAQYGACDGYRIDELVAREAGRMRVDPGELDRPLSTFSPGERTRLMLAALFLRHGGLLLIDEPTNHLDMEGRGVMAQYLRAKQGFILVSHDRWFLDNTVDHIMALHKDGVRIEHSDYSTYRENKRLKDEYEQAENRRLEGEIRRLRETAGEKAMWSGRVEATKIGTGAPDRGYVGHLSAKMMKRALAIRGRIDQKIAEKEGLLSSLEYASALSLHPLAHSARVLIRMADASAGYAGRPVFEHRTLEVEQGDRICLAGPNGSGKSTMVKLLVGEKEPMAGRCTRASGLVVSYMPQRADALCGAPFELAKAQGLRLDYFIMLLRKLDFPREALERDMRDYSLGQRKKVLLAASMSRDAHIYLWDEPLNYIDLESREQVENMLAESDATLIFVEHDRRFVERLATKTVDLGAPGPTPKKR